MLETRGALAPLTPVSSIRETMPCSKRSLRAVSWVGVLAELAWAGAVALPREAHTSESMCGAPGFVVSWEGVEEVGDFCIPPFAEGAKDGAPGVSDVVPGVGALS